MSSYYLDAGAPMHRCRETVTPSRNRESSKYATEFGWYCTWDTFRGRLNISTRRMLEESQRDEKHRKGEELVKDEG
jgi:hypothetical protein